MRGSQAMIFSVSRAEDGEGFGPAGRWGGVSAASRSELGCSGGRCLMHEELLLLVASLPLYSVGGGIGEE